MLIFHQVVHYFKALGGVWILGLTLLSSPLLSSLAIASECKSSLSVYQKGSEFFSAGQYLLSASHFSMAESLACDPSFARKSLYAYALSMAELNEVGEVNRTLPRLFETDLGPKSKLLGAYLFPEMQPKLGESDRFRLGLWNERLSSNFRQKLESPHPSISPIHENELLQLNHEILEAPSKSPVFASLASTALPGAGQAYVGTWQSAAVSFILNSLFLATTLELARKDLPVAAVASGMVFSVTYIGNILNANDAAKRFNENARVRSEDSLKKTLFPEFHP